MLSVQMDSVDDTICAQTLLLYLYTMINLTYSHYPVGLTEYFALVASSSPSLSQLIIGLGFPWAEQLSIVLPPSFASTYCGGVDVNVGGAVERETTEVVTLHKTVLFGTVFSVRFSDSFLNLGNLVPSHGGFLESICLSFCSFCCCNGFKD